MTYEEAMKEAKAGKRGGGSAVTEQELRDALVRADKIIQRLSVAWLIDDPPRPTDEDRAEMMAHVEFMEGIIERKEPEPEPEMTEAEREEVFQRKKRAWIKQGALRGEAWKRANPNWTGPRKP